MDTKHFLEQLGGYHVVAAKLGVSRSAVANWRLPGRGIPWKHRPALARMAADRAVDLPAGYWMEKVA